MSNPLRSRLLTIVVSAVIAGTLGISAAHAESPTGPRLAGMTVEPEPPTKGEKAAQIALKAVGVPYRWGGESPSSGFDCSGLVRWAYGKVGIDLPHNSYALYGEGRRVSESRLEPGDVLFFEGLGHVGLYLGRGRMVHAPQTGRTVEVVRLDGSSFGIRLIGARRFVSN